MNKLIALLAAGACALASGARAQDTNASQPAAAAQTGPKIELPPEAAQPQPPAHVGSGVQLGAPSDSETLTRGLYDARMSQPNTVIGGYGQFNLNVFRNGNKGPFDAQATVRRLVLFVAHPITDDIRIYTEFEYENAGVCDECKGEAEVEQAFVNWRLLGDALALRAGLVLVPMGIINQWHEPPVFNGVERPSVDQLIIPTTWRELGAGFVGSLAEIVRYELYLTTTLNPLKLSETGLGGGLQFGSLAQARAFAVTGRAEVEPILGFVAGASFYASNLGPNGTYYDASGHKRDLSLPLFGYALDARIRRLGFEGRAVWAQFFLPHSGELVTSFREDGSPLFPPEMMAGTVPTRLQGGYVELAYDFLHLLHVTHQLLGFVRLETYNTQAAVPSGFSKDPALNIDELTTGLTYRPITQLVFKTDVQLRNRQLGLDTLQWNLGFGYMF